MGTRIFSFLGRTCCKFMPLFRLRQCKHMEPCELRPQYLDNHLSWDHDIRHADCIRGVDDLINFWQNSITIWLNYVPFPTYYVNKVSGEPHELGS